MWITLFEHLCLRSWYAMMSAFNGNTLGFLATVFGIGGCIWLIGFVFEWREAKSIQIGLSKAKKFVLVDFIGITLFLLIAVPIFVVRTIAYDHNGLRYEVLQDKVLINSLQADIEYRRNNLPYTDPVFINTRDLLAGFSVYRHYMNGEACSIYVTSPQETEKLAMMFSMLSNVTSGCMTSSQVSNTGDPAIDMKMTDGMVADAVLVHSSHSNDRAVNELMMQLANRIRMIRRYDDAPSQYAPPPGGFKHTIWFQFGGKVKWASESGRVGQ